MIALVCPHCQQHIQMKDAQAGRSAPCPACAKPVQVPARNGQTATLPSRSGLEEQQAISATLPPSGPLTASGRPENLDVPGYEIVGELGRGGMGVAYDAWQRSPRRRVALKMILAGAHAGAEALARFREEAQALGELNHPNIVQVFELGERGGCPFFALEFCAGGSLAAKLDGTPWPALKAAGLVETLAQAMNAAHAKGIIHRDLKPANVLLTAAGEPKITDFGLARRVEGGSGQTQTGAILGTPSYMATEQAEGKKNVGPAADVYALGAILYELLTGRPPFRAETPLDTVLQVVSDEPVPPSRLNAKVSRDLETICLKCLEKDPRWRYSTGGELADDLRRFQAGEPIAARPVGAVERAVKWARRRPAVAAVVGVGAVAALVLVGLLVSLGYGRQQASAYQREQGLRTVAEQARERLGEEKQKTEAALEGEQRARAGEAAAKEQLEQTLYLRRVAGAYAGWKDNEVARARQMLADCSPTRRNWEWHFVTRICEGSKLTLKGHNNSVLSACFSTDGRRVAGVSTDGTVKVWDAQTGQEALTLEGRVDLPNSLCFSPDGQRLASAGGVVGSPGEVKLWDAQTGKVAPSLKGHTNAISSVCFSPDGQRLASASFDHTVRVWDARTANVEMILKGHAGPVTSVMFHPDGQRLASAAIDGSVRVWDIQTGQVALALKSRQRQILSVCFSPGGQRLASAGGISGTAGEVNVWDAQTGQVALTLKGHREPVACICFSPDGQRIASASFDETVRVWDAQTGQLATTFWGHTGPVRSVSYSPDGHRLVTASLDGPVKIWDAQGSQEALTHRGRTARGTSAAILGVCFSPDGKRLACAAADPVIRVLDAQTGQEVFAFKGHTSGVNGVCFSPDGQRLASAGGDRWVKVWDVQTGRETLQLTQHESMVTGVCFSPDGRRLASGSLDKTIKVWDAETGGEIFTLTGHINVVSCVCFSPDSQRLASASGDQTVRVWDAKTGQELVTLQGHMSAVRAVCFSPDGRRLASLTSLEEIKLWDARTWQEVHSLKALSFKGLPGNFHPGGLCFSPDGRRLAGAALDRTVRVWDAETGQEALTLKGHVGEVTGVCFSPDGHRLATASLDGTVKIWDATPVEPASDKGPEALRK